MAWILGTVRNERHFTKECTWEGTYLAASLESGVMVHLVTCTRHMEVHVVQETRDPTNRGSITGKTEMKLLQRKRRLMCVMAGHTNKSTVMGKRFSDDLQVPALLAISALFCNARHLVDNL